MALSAAEIAQLEAEADAAGFSLTKTLSKIAAATKGSALRGALYQMAYWLQNHAISAQYDWSQKQDRLEAGSNITIDETDALHPTISATDTKNTAGCQALTLSSGAKAYLVISPTQGDDAADYAETGTLSDVYIQNDSGTNNLYVGGITVNDPQTYYFENTSGQSVTPTASGIGIIQASAQVPSTTAARTLTMMVTVSQGTSNKYYYESFYVPASTAAYLSMTVPATVVANRAVSFTVKNGSTVITPTSNRIAVHLLHGSDRAH